MRITLLNYQMHAKKMLLIASLMGFAACSSGNKHSGSTPAPAEVPEAPVDPVDIGNGDVEQLSSVSLLTRNYMEIYQSFLNLTGVSEVQSIKDALANFGGIMPTGNDADQYTGSNQVGIFRLADAVCQQLYVEESNSGTKKGFFGAANISGGDYAAVLNAAGIDAIVKAYMTRLWIYDASKITTSDSEYKELSTLITNPAGGDGLVELIRTNRAGATGQQIIQGAVVGSCIAALSSLQVILK